jgi:cell filamentation protein, protein adenylyltransferase
MLILSGLSGTGNTGNQTNTGIVQKCCTFRRTYAALFNLLLQEYSEEMTVSYIILTSKERDNLIDLFFRLKGRGELNPTARMEALTALRCLKAVHSNAIEDKRVDRIFLQVLLHGAGVPDKSLISGHYDNASKELMGQEKMLRWLEVKAAAGEKFSLTLLLEMHRIVFSESRPESAGRFRQDEVRIKGMAHRPPHHSKIQEILYQKLGGINERLSNIGPITRSNFFEVIRLSAEIHYLVASVHPFEDGNGRISRASGDYAMLVHGFYYDVIMTDYREMYLDALEECTAVDSVPLLRFLEYSYLETLRRIAGFFQLVDESFD